MWIVYWVLVYNLMTNFLVAGLLVSVAGCDVLVDEMGQMDAKQRFSCWLFKLRCTEIIKNKFWLGLCIAHTEFF